MVSPTMTMSAITDVEIWSDNFKGTTKWHWWLNSAIEYLYKVWFRRFISVDYGINLIGYYLFVIDTTLLHTIVHDTIYSDMLTLEWPMRLFIIGLVDITPKHFK